jgi:anthranilate/para-aminobenzoate synthase component I
MLSKLTYKIVLEYFLDNKKVIYSNEMSNDGLATITISVGNNKVIETTINGRVLSGESIVNGVKSGYEYVYDTEGVTIDLRQKNSNVSINDSVSLINKLKSSSDFFKAKMNGVLAINNSSELISEPNINFLVYREVTLSDNENTQTYFIQQNFTSDGQKSKLNSEEETYQINDDYASFITNYKDDSQSVYCNIDDEEFESIDKDTPEYIIVQSMMSKLNPLKDLVKSTPKTYKDIKLEQQKENTKKTIR